MLVDPKEVLNYDPLYQETLPSPGMDFADASGVWVTVRSNLHFIIQRHWERIRAIDLDIPIPFRILHPAKGFKVFVVVSEAKTSQEVLEDWAFLKSDLLPTMAKVIIHKSRSEHFLWNINWYLGSLYWKKFIGQLWATFEGSFLCFHGQKKRCFLRTL